MLPTCSECHRKLPKQPAPGYYTDMRAATDEEARALLMRFQRNPTRRGDPIGSKLASQMFSERSGIIRVRAYAYLLTRGEQGAILQEIAEAVGVAENSLSPLLSIMRDNLDLIDGPGPELRSTYGIRFGRPRASKQGVWRARRWIKEA